MPSPASAVETAVSSRRRSRGLTIAVRAGQALLGLVVALVLAELGFRWRDDGAFPHVNLYVPDPELGVRLAPGGEQRFQLAPNPTTSIRINALGYRGGDWPAPGDGELLVVGDSQVFGLGVEEDQTLSARIGALAGRTSLNGGVPTYGPLEYNAVIAEVLARRKVATVVYVVNLANDLFEWDRPNRERHAVWDGWAVRKETAPREVAGFPGRGWLMSRSHLVYAARRWLAKDDPRDERGLPSEGAWHDIVGLGDDAAARKASAASAATAANQARAAQLGETDQALAKVEDELIGHTLEVFELYSDSDEAFLVQAAHGKPGDIVVDNYSEEGRGIQVTADLIRKGAAYRKKLEAEVGKRKATEARQRLVDALVKRDQLAAQRASLHDRPLASAHVASVMLPRLVEAKALCDAAGAELVVVALPLDVMVSAAEWSKYGKPPIDMRSSHTLIDDLVASARELGVRAIDVSPSLTNLPGAFLDHDLHLTPVGVDAVAKVVIAGLAGPPPLARPGRDLPPGRSRVPSPAEWATSPEAVVRGSSKLGCETVVVREWLRVVCRRGGGRQPAGITGVDGDRGEAMTLLDKDAMVLVLPLFAGQSAQVDFVWQKASARLSIDWPAGAKRAGMAFDPRPADATPLAPRAPSADEARLCACYLEVAGERRCEVDEYGNPSSCEPICDGLYGRVEPACSATYPDCASLLACAAGDPGFPPTCPDGAANAFPDGHCAPLCGPAAPCAEGACVPWQGASVCD